MTEPLLRIEGYSLTLRSGDGPVRILDDLDLTIGHGEVVGLAGESGSGKTMTSLSIMRLLPHHARTEGRILVEGTDVLAVPPRALRRLRGPTIGMVFQDPMTSLHPAIRVGEQIAEAVRAHEKVSRAAAQARAVEMLRLVGIPDPAGRSRQYPHQFSGGMQQRVVMAIALACRPKLLIADEPTTALDVTVQAQVVDLLRDLRAELGMAILFVSHDLGLLSNLCERLVIMYGGQVVEDASTEQVFSAPRHPYTHALLHAVPDPTTRGGRLMTIPGAPPQPGKLSGSCRFAPRCAYAVDACLDRDPPLEAPEPGRSVRCVRHAELELTREPVPT
ncbi:MAG: ABC transporter ATP-binding protein [Acidimicrobiia bacterium]